MNFVMPWFGLLFGLLWWMQYRSAQHAQSPWLTAIESAELRQHLLGDASVTPRGWGFWLALNLMVLALMQPRIDLGQSAQYRSNMARVVVMDLSPSMLASDLSPSRAKRAQFKLRDILALSQADRVALVGMAAASYVLSPLTEDQRTLELMIDGLDPELAPVPGGNVAAALDAALSLLVGEGAQEGQVILLSDATATTAGDVERAMAAASSINAAGYQLSVVGTATDSKIQVNYQGMSELTQFDPAFLNELAGAGGGAYVEMRADDGDLAQIWQQASGIGSRAGAGSGQAIGPYVLLLALLLLAISWRNWA